MTVRTQQGIATGALVTALALGLRGDHLDRSLDDALELGQSIMHHALARGKGRGSLHPVIADALAALGKPMRHHPANTRRDIDCVRLDPLGLMGPSMIRDAVAILAVDPSDRD